MLRDTCNAMKKNILHAIDTTGPGGAETVFIGLISKLNANKYNSIVVIRGKGWVYEELMNRGVEPHIVPAKGSFNLTYLYTLIKLIRKYRINVIQSHLFGSNVYCSLAGFITRVPVISIFHGAVDVAEKEKYLWAKIQIINFGSRYIVMVSKHLKNILLSNTALQKNKSIVIYNGVDSEQYYPDKNNFIRDELEFKKSDIIVCSVGNIRKPKGYDVLLKSAAIVCNDNPEYKFIIIGQGAGELMDDLNALRDKLNLTDNVFFLGFRNDIKSILSGADIFVLCSTSEGFSISTVEAMACGIPVIATRSGGPEEIVLNGNDGFLVDVNSETQLAEAVLKISAVKNDLISNGVGKVRQYFSINTMLKSYEKLYDEIG